MFNNQDKKETEVIKLQTKEKQKHHALVDFRLHYNGESGIFSNASVVYDITFQA